MKEEEFAVYYSRGHQNGVLAERKRIIEALRDEAESRSLFEALAYPYLISELEETIMRGQDE